MSLVEARATFKPQNVARTDQFFDQVPDELDLSAAVSLYEQPFVEPLRALDSARTAVHLWDRALRIAGLACVGLGVLLWMLCAVSRRTLTFWIGTTLILAALGVGAAGYAAHVLVPRRLTSDWLPTLPVALSGPLQGLARHVLADVLDRLKLGALVGTGLGWLVIWTPLLVRDNRWADRTSALRAIRGWVTVLTVTSVLYIVYVEVGAAYYAQALQRYGSGEIEQACLLYRRVDRLAPFANQNYVTRARTSIQECDLVQTAEAAYRSGKWERAIRHYEALLLTHPALPVLDVAELHLLESLVRSARELEADGSYERALDRYRYVRDEDLGRDRQIDGQPVRIHESIARLYLDWGDSLLEGQDPLGALATYRRILVDTSDPRMWAIAEERIIDATCAGSTLLEEQNQPDRAAELCSSLELDFPSLPAGRCPACTP
jgi:tetratricopeptide (TPR) repeat protein